MAMRSMRAQEVALGITFPSSFVEWFGLREGADLLRRHSNSDDPVEIEHLGEPVPGGWGKKRDFVREGLLPFMIENQGVCLWALRLDGGDDPGVVVAE